MSLSKTLYHLLKMVQPRKTRPDMTEKMSTGTYRIKLNGPLAQLQRNRAGECSHKSLLRRKKVCRSGYRPGLT